MPPTIWKVLNVTNSHVTNSRFWPLLTKRNLADTKITVSRPRNYGSWKCRQLVLKIASKREQSDACIYSAVREQFRWIIYQNRSKSGAKIWSVAKNVVPLQSIREMLCECGLRLSIAALAGWTISDIASPAYRVMIPAVIMVASMRFRQTALITQKI